MSFAQPVRLTIGAVALALFGLAGLPVLTATPSSAQYYDDNGPDDGAYDGRRYDRGYDDRYDRGDDQQPWDTAGDGDDVDVSFFYDELQDDGRWISHRDFGYVWSPNNVDDDWRPYTRGHWVNTDDYGWYWVSEERWGWATYHYGRWFLDDRYGWLWVPGSTWGPAWVAWRSSDSYVGWAPLPPDAYWGGRNGLRYDSAAFESPRYAAYWSFVEPRYISTPNIYRYCAPRYRARTIIYSTRPQTRYDFRGDRIVNVGISVNFFDRFLPSPLRSVHVYTTEGRFARGFDRQAGNSVRVWRPDLRRQYRDAARPRDRQWAAGSWRNVDRPSRRAAQPTNAPATPFQPSMMGRPLQVPGLPNAGLPPSGRTTYTRPPAATAPPPVNQPRYDDRDRDRGNWNRGDRDRDDGRGRSDNRGRDDGRTARGTPPAPPAANTAPSRPNGNWNRDDRGRDDGRPGRSAAPTPPPAITPPRPTATTTPPTPVPPGNTRPNPGAFDPARRPAARGKPASPPSGTPPAQGQSASSDAQPPAASPADAKAPQAPADPTALVRRSFTGAPQGGVRTPPR